eukprot:2387874-Amphidinium_carterae.1
MCADLLPTCATTSAALALSTAWLQTTGVLNMCRSAGFGKCRNARRECLAGYACPSSEMVPSQITHAREWEQLIRMHIGSGVVLPFLLGNLVDNFH